MRCLQPHSERTRLRNLLSAATADEISNPRSLLRVRDSIVDFQSLERCGLRRIEAEFLPLFAEEVTLFWMVVETACLHFFSPMFDFLRRFFSRRFDLAIRPSPDRLRPVRFALEILSLHAFDKQARFFRNFMPMKTRIRSQRTQDSGRP